MNRAEVPKAELELKIARLWWVRVYARLVHGVPVTASLPKSGLDRLLAEDLGVHLHSVRSIRAGSQNVGPKGLEKLRIKLGPYLPAHPPEIMGVGWKDHIAGTMGLIQKQGGFD